MEPDWDLFAVIRGTSCGQASTDFEPRTAAYSLLDDSLFSYDLGFSSDCFFSNSKQGTLDELFTFQHRKDDDDDALKDELCDISSSSASSSMTPITGRVLSCNPQPQNNIANTQTVKRRRKNQLKKVRQVPADSLMSSDDDTWSWRKYGQKPIKGSPYPRGYYKCSTLKGCPARKQVERNKTDANMFIVTYTAEHNHSAPTQRNSLAGTIRSNKNLKKFDNVVTPVGTCNVSRELEQQKEEVRRLSSSEEEGEMMRMIGDDVDGDGDGGGGGWSMEMEDDFFDGLDGELKNVGIGYW